MRVFRDRSAFSSNVVRCIIAPQSTVSKVYCRFFRLNRLISNIFSASPKPSEPTTPLFLLFTETNNQEKSTHTATTRRCPRKTRTQCHIKQISHAGFPRLAANKHRGHMVATGKQNMPGFLGSRQNMHRGHKVAAGQTKSCRVSKARGKDTPGTQGRIRQNTLLSRTPGEM